MTRGWKVEKGGWLGEVVDVGKSQPTCCISTNVKVEARSRHHMPSQPRYSTGSKKDEERDTVQRATRPVKGRQLERRRGGKITRFAHYRHICIDCMSESVTE